MPYESEEKGRKTAWSTLKLLVPMKPYTPGSCFAAKRAARCFRAFGEEDTWSDQRSPHWILPLIRQGMKNRRFHPSLYRGSRSRGCTP